MGNRQSKKTQQPADADVARVDDSSAALRASGSERTVGCLSPQFCSVVLGSRCAVLMCASTAAGLQLPRARCSDLSAWRCSGARVYEAGLSGEERVMGMGGGGVGLLALRMTDTGGACGRDVKRLLMAVVKRVAAVRATATPEGLFERGQREYDEGLYASAAQSWGRAVDLKHAHAHALLSTMLIEGRPDVPKDDKRAFGLASGGAGMGCAHSKGVLGRCYSAGFGVAANHSLSVALGRESAAAGSCMGQSVLAVCFYFGEGGVAQDHAEAVRLWRLAAAQGLANAQYNLGNMFRDGKGVAQDHAEAVRLYRLAAAQGHAAAHSNLGLMFGNGQGVAQDSAQAVKLFRLAAAQGHAIAKFNLGYMFECGNGVARDRAEAIRWFRLAAAQGDTKAAAALQRLGA